MMNSYRQRFAGSLFLHRRSWGFAALHPRLYAAAALRGLKTNVVFIISRAVAV